MVTGMADWKNVDVDDDATVVVDGVIDKMGISEMTSSVLTT